MWFTNVDNNHSILRYSPISSHFFCALIRLLQMDFIFSLKSAFNVDYYFLCYDSLLCFKIFLFSFFSICINSWILVFFVFDRINKQQVSFLYVLQTIPMWLVVLFINGKNEREKKLKLIFFIYAEEWSDADSVQFKFNKLKKKQRHSVCSSVFNKFCRYKMKRKKKNRHERGSSLTSIMSFILSPSLILACIFYIFFNS